MKEDIFRFEIPVHDFELVKDLESIDDLFEEVHHIGFTHLFLFFDPLLEGAAIAVLVDEVMVVLAFNELMELNDVFAVAHLGEDLHLVDQALFYFGIGLQETV